MKKFLIILIIVACVASLGVYVGHTYPEYDVLHIFVADPQKTTNIEADLTLKSYVECGKNVTISSNDNMLIEFDSGAQDASAMVQLQAGTPSITNGETARATLNLNAAVNVARGYTFKITIGNKVVGTGTVTKVSP